MGGVGVDIVIGTGCYDRGVFFIWLICVVLDLRGVLVVSQVLSAQNNWPELALAS